MVNYFFVNFKDLFQKEEMWASANITGERLNFCTTSETFFQPTCTVRLSAAKVPLGPENKTRTLKV
jgi:hypothetical protein